MGWTDWTDLVPFTDHFEIRHYVGHAAAKRDWNTTLEGVSGHLSTAEGLWPVDGGKFDFTDIDVSKIPVGIYFIRIEGEKVITVRLLITWVWLTHKKRFISSWHFSKSV